ncbi:Ser-Thr-rich GPI-anchored membrane family protein [Cellulomonas endophytica]|uniref:Ser-Thr-rich GPI-anchored membrane family protein n=1 Tax=Cellulomonas endophytica TaxID=2494735 RepID=UPI001013AC2B|nr:Ser-Thr-rich GPI-anchored membrane family protein [Cellulomonas endophytica]
MLSRSRRRARALPPSTPVAGPRPGRPLLRRTAAVVAAGAVGLTGVAAAPAAWSSDDAPVATGVASADGVLVPVPGATEPGEGPGVVRAQTVEVGLAGLPAPAPAAAEDVPVPVADDPADAGDEVPGAPAAAGDEVPPGDAAPVDAAPATAVDLALFPDLVVGTLLTPARTEGEATVWSGRVVDAGGAGEAGGSVVLVEHDGGLSGSVAVGDDVYRLTAVAAGTSLVEQVDPAALPAAGDDEVRPGDADAYRPVAGDAPAPDAADGLVSSLVAAASDADADAGTAADGSPVVDVLVGYSTAAKDARGGQVAMESDVLLAIAQTNEAFAESGIGARVRLTRAVEVPLNGDVTSAVLSRTANPGDGWNDGLHVLRDADGADLVALVVDDAANQACGIAYVQGAGAGFAPYGVSLVDVHCSTGTYSFTHELGHNFGAAHDRGSWSGTPAYPYGYGWVNATARFRTVMAYANACAGCARVLRFSNPDLTLNGYPLGAPIGATNQADQRALVNVTAPVTAAFRGAPVPASLAVTAPAEAARVTAPGTTTVRWTRTGNVGTTVRVELLPPTGAAVVLATAAPAGVDALPWKVASTLARGDGYRVRVTSVLDPSLTSTSEPFALVDPVLTVTAPAGGETWAVGTPRTVSWTSTGTPTGYVKLTLERPGATPVVLTSTAKVGTDGVGSFTWTPAATLGAYDDYAVRATLTAVPAVTDASAGALTLTGGPAVRLTSGTPTEPWRAGGTYTTTWTTSGTVGSTVLVELLRGTTVAATVASNVPAGNGTVTWKAPASLADGTYRVRVSSTSLRHLSSSTDELVLLGTSIVAGDPADGTAWTAGTPRTLTWTPVGLPGASVKLELVRPSGATVLVSAGRPLAAGSYTWTPPLTTPPAADYRVRVTVVGNTAVTATSATDLAVVRPTIAAPTPAEAQTWTTGAPVTLGWRLTPGVTAPVKVELVRGTAVTVVAASAPTAADGTGSVTWTPPVALTAASGYRVRVSAVADRTLTATAPGEVTLVAPTLTLTSAGTGWAAGASSTVTWTLSGGATTPVKVELLRGTTPAVLAASAPTPGGHGSLTYRVATAQAAGEYRVRVTVVGLASRTVTSDPFALTGTAIGVGDPADGQAWTKGAPRTLTWAPVGAPGTAVKVELVRPSGATVLVSPSRAISPGTLVWSPPLTAPTAADYRVRVTVVGNTAVTATSTTDLSLVAPALAVTGPSAGGTWAPGSTQTVTWTLSGGSTAPVLVELVGATKKYVVATAAATPAGAGTLTWKVPTTLLPGAYTLRLRPAATGTSAAVQATVAVTVAPAG